LAQSVWWISSIIGLQQSLINHIDNLQDRLSKLDLSDSEISSTPRDLQSEQADLVLDRAEKFIKESKEARKEFTTRQRDRVNPLPQTKRQFKKARKLKRLQAENLKLQEIRNQVIRNLSKE
jgi:hypothetical protein